MSNVDKLWLIGDHTQGKEESIKLKTELGIFKLQSCSSNKEMYKISLMHVQSCCFAQQIYCFFDILVSVVDVIAKVPYCLITCIMPCIASSESARENPRNWEIQIVPSLAEA